MAVHKPECMLYQLIVEEEVLIFELVVGQAGGLVGILSKHHAHAEHALVHAVEHFIYERDVLISPSFRNLGPLEFSA